jgi:hypothetical protein
MPITPTNPFKGRHFPGEVILLCVRWYLRYPLAYEHVGERFGGTRRGGGSELHLAWVQAYAPELNKRCRPHLKPTNKSYRYGRDLYKGQRRRQISVSRRGLDRPNHRIPAHGQTGRGRGQTLSSARP